jgi:hypothetical protein
VEIVCRNGRRDELLDGNAQGASPSPILHAPHPFPPPTHLSSFIYNLPSLSNVFPSILPSFCGSFRPCLPSIHLAFLPAYLPAYLAYLPTYLPTSYLPTYLPTYLT